MHTFEGDTIKIFHNGDYSGECVIFNKTTNQDIRVDSEDLLKYAAEYIRSKRIQELECIDYKDILR